MKKINFILGAIVFAGLGLTSCSNDDDNNTGKVGIAGTYKLSEVNTGTTGTDFNEDDVVNKNQMKESDCYNNSKIALNADNTFTYDIKTILVNTVDGTSACSAVSVGGTWSATGSGDNAVITAVYENENKQDVTVTFTKAGNVLKNTKTLAQYPDRNANGGAIYSVGTVELVFDKQ